MEISVIMPYISLDEEMDQMTRDCTRSLLETMTDADELIPVEDTELKGNSWAWNEGARRARGDYLLFSDNDIDARHWREPMIKALSKYDVVFPVVYNEKLARDERMLAGMFWLIRRDLFERLGRIDESYGSYFEDTDFFMKVIRDGGKLGIADDAYVVHRSQGTFSKLWSAEKMREVFDRNKAKYESKFGLIYPHLADE